MLHEKQKDRSGRITVFIEQATMTAAGLAVDAPVSVALSLGTEAATPSDASIVSNVVVLHWQNK